MGAMRSGVIWLLLAAAPAAFASTQAAQGQQNSHMFGIPPLPVILGAAGASLKQINSPITLNTHVVQDPAPAQQQQVHYGQAAAAGDSTPQQYVSSSDQTVATTIAQPSTGGQAAAGSSGYWIQNADGSRTPLSDDDPILLQVNSCWQWHVQQTAAAMAAAELFAVWHGVTLRRSSTTCPSSLCVTHAL